jgi:hypothetical protein
MHQGAHPYIITASKFMGLNKKEPSRQEKGDLFIRERRIDFFSGFLLPVFLFYRVGSRKLTAFRGQPDDCFSNQYKLFLSLLHKKNIL